MLGSPGRVPPALHVTSSERAPMQTWDPAGDILIPDNGAEIAYAPPIVIAPPQLPVPESHPQRQQFPARALKAFFDTGAADRQPSQLGFVAHSIQVDNLSNQWLWFPSARRFVPPSMFSVVLQVVDGCSSAEWHVQIPTGHAAGTVGTASGPVISVWFEDYFPASSGSGVAV
jgi:hypothetical protein